MTTMTVTNAPLKYRKTLHALSQAEIDPTRSIMVSLPTSLSSGDEVDAVARLLVNPEKYAVALLDPRAADPVLWDRINEAHQKLVEKSFLSALTASEKERLERLGRALDKFVEPYDLARLAAVDTRQRHG